MQAYIVGINTTITQQMKKHTQFSAINFLFVQDDVCATRKSRADVTTKNGVVVFKTSSNSNIVFIVASCVFFRLVSKITTSVAHFS